MDPFWTFFFPSLLCFTKIHWRHFIFYFTTFMFSITVNLVLSICTVQQSDPVTYICMYMHMYIHIHILFLTLSFIMLHHKWLGIVPWIRPNQSEHARSHVMSFYKVLLYLLQFYCPDYCKFLPVYLCKCLSWACVYPGHANGSEIFGPWSECVNVENTNFFFYRVII